MKKQQIQRKDYKYLAVFIGGLILAVFLYYFKRNFYMAVVPIIVVGAIALVFYYLDNRTKTNKTRKGALAYLNYLEAVSNKTDLGTSFKIAAIEESKTIQETEFKTILSSYLNEEEYGSIFAPNYFEVSSEQELNSLFQFGLTHQISAEFKDSFANSLNEYRNFLEKKDDNKNKTENILNIIFLGLVVIISFVLLIYLFKSLL